MAVRKTQKKKAGNKKPDELDLTLTWIPIEQVLLVVGISRSCLNKWCAERRLDERCARKIGRRWYFNLPLIKSEGFLLRD